MGTGKRFDGGKWVRKQTDIRTREELERQDREFIAQHENDPNSELLVFLIKRTRELGYVPSATEITGGQLLIDRFGSWDQAVIQAGYRYSKGPSKLKKTQRYKEEYIRQSRLFKQEREEKKRLRAERAAERQGHRDSAHKSQSD